MVFPPCPVVRVVTMGDFRKPKIPYVRPTETSVLIGELPVSTNPP